MATVYVLIIILAGLIFLLIRFVVNREKIVEKRTEELIASRLKYHERQEKRNQSKLIDLKFKEWKYQNEFDIRRTAIKKADDTILKSISDDVLIIRENFSFNPKDVKFIGRFIDLVIFDGASKEKEVSIYFVDIIHEKDDIMLKYKSLVQDAIENKSVFFKEIRL